MIYDTALLIFEILDRKLFLLTIGKYGLKDPRLEIIFVICDAFLAHYASKY